MGTGTAVTTGDVITAAKMNLKLETVAASEVDSGVAFSRVFHVNGPTTIVKIIADHKRYFLGIIIMSFHQITSTAIIVRGKNNLAVLYTQGVSPKHNTEIKSHL